VFGKVEDERIRATKGMTTMYWYGSIWPMGVMMVGWPLLAGLVVALIVWLVSGRDSRPDATAGARRVLAERYARGELDTDEYRNRLAALR
jgi:putative membrane protein